MASEDEKPGTWAESDEKTAEYNALVKENDGDVEEATRAELRGEKPDPDDESSPATS
jgi:hypothetical protein